MLQSGESEVAQVVQEGPLKLSVSLLDSTQMSKTEHVGIYGDSWHVCLLTLGMALNWAAVLLFHRPDSKLAVSIDFAPSSSLPCSVRDLRMLPSLIPPAPSPALEELEAKQLGS